MHGGGELFDRVALFGGATAYGWAWGDRSAGMLGSFACGIGSSKELVGVEVGVRN